MSRRIIGIRFPSHFVSIEESATVDVTEQNLGTYGISWVEVHRDGELSEKHNLLHAESVYYAKEATK